MMTPRPAHGAGREVGGEVVARGYWYGTLALRFMSGERVGAVDVDDERGDQPDADAATARPCGAGAAPAARAGTRCSRRTRSAPRYIFRLPMVWAKTKPISTDAGDAPSPTSCRPPSGTARRATACAGRGSLRIGLDRDVRAERRRRLLGCGHERTSGWPVDGTDRRVDEACRRPPDRVRTLAIGGRGAAASCADDRRRTSWRSSAIVWPADEPRCRSGWRRRARRRRRQVVAADGADAGRRRRPATSPVDDRGARRCRSVPHPTVTPLVGWLDVASATTSHAVLSVPRTDGHAQPYRSKRYVRR